MLSSASRIFFVFVLIGIGVAVSVAQEVETIKTDTNLVTVPVIVTSRNGLYITDLTKDEFKISEDGVPHEIAFFWQGLCVCALYLVLCSLFASEVEYFELVLS